MAIRSVRPAGVCARLVGLGLLALVVGCASADGQSIHDVVIVGPEGETTPLRLPARLDRAGLLPRRASRYQVRAHVALAPNLVGHELVLVLPSLSARASASIDGEPMGAVRGGATRGYRQRPPLAWSVPGRLTGDGALEVTIFVEHTWTQSAWLTAAPELVVAGHGLGRGTWVERVNLPLAAAGLAVAISVGLVMAWVYLIDRSRRASGYFAIQALAAAVYPAHVSGLLIPLGRFEVPVMGTGLVIGITAAVYYTHAFFDSPAPSRWWARAAAATIAVFWLSTDPFWSSDIAGRVMVVYLTLTLVIMLVTITRIIRLRGGREAWQYLLPWLSLALSSPPDLLAWAGIADPLAGARCTVVAFVLFPLLLELLLNQQHVGTLNDANLLLAGQVRDLEARRTEIEQLNNELRRQISDRAGQIQAALLLARGRAGTAPVLVPGEVVQGRYRVERPIGAGGMGTVYEVTRLVDGRRLALKLAREVNGEALARMAREAQTAASVTNPHIVAMLDVDVASAGFLFLVMELVDGKPLSSQHDRFGDRAWALAVLAQLADGLAALHQGGVIHRDLKPSNVLLARADDGALQVKITDFGISVPETYGSSDATFEDAGGSYRSGLVDAVDRKPTALDPPVPARLEATRELASISWEIAASDATSATKPSPMGPRLLPRGPLRARAEPGGKDGAGRSHDSGSAPLTRTGFLSGTPAYMAPELAEGRHRLVLAADLFAFGVIARELITGHRPYAQPLVLALIEGRPTPAVASLAESWPEAPAHLVHLLDACLDFAPSARPTASVLAVALAAALAVPGS